MSIPAKVKNYLAKHKIKFELVPHRTVFTVYDLAQTLKIKMNTITKTLLVKADKEYYLAVLPAHKRLDLKALQKTLQAKTITLAKEKDMLSKFKMKPGAMTPFGQLHQVTTIMDKSLLKTDKMLLGAGSFTESIRMKIKDYVKSQNPTVAAISEKTKK